MHQISLNSNLITPHQIARCKMYPSPAPYHVDPAETSVLHQANCMEINTRPLCLPTSPSSTNVSATYIQHVHITLTNHRMRNKNNSMLLCYFVTKKHQKPLNEYKPPPRPTITPCIASQYLLLNSKSESVSYLKCSLTSCVQNLCLLQPMSPRINTNINNVLLHTFKRVSYQTLWKFSSKIL